MSTTLRPDPDLTVSNAVSCIVPSVCACTEGSTRQSSAPTDLARRRAAENGDTHPRLPAVLSLFSQPRKTFDDGEFVRLCEPPRSINRWILRPIVSPFVGSISGALTLPPRLTCRILKRQHILCGRHYSCENTRHPGEKSEANSTAKSMLYMRRH